MHRFLHSSSVIRATRGQHFAGLKRKKILRPRRFPPTCCRVKGSCAVGCGFHFQFMVMDHPLQLPNVCFPSRSSPLA